MRGLRAALVFAMTVLLAPVLVRMPSASASADTSAQVVCHLRDSRIDEASGIARGIASPGVLYVQNDSGDTNRFFALDARTCATVATITVSGAGSVDWEDIAVAPDRRGTPSVWIADTGDNDARRAEIAVYRIDEPRIRAGQTSSEVRSGTPDIWRLRYPNGPTDAESLAVSPRGVGYLVTKSYTGASTVYRLPTRPDPHRVQQLVPIGTMQFTPTTLTSLTAAAKEVAATSAAISRDGTRLVVRTYTDAYLWPVSDGDIVAALRVTPTRVPLPDQPQGEGVAFDGAHLLLDSEQRGSAVYSLPLPLPARAGASVTASPSAAPSTASSSSPRTGSGTSPATGSATSGAQRGHGGNGSWLPGLVVLSLVVLGAAGWWTLQLRGRAGR